MYDSIWCPEGVDPRNWYGWMAGELGDTQTGDPYMIWVRGPKSTDQLIHHKPGYDDRTILLTPNQAPVLFDSCTHSYQVNSTASPGGNVGSIRPGHLLFHDMQAGKYPIFHITDLVGNDPLCWRDFDHDGIIGLDDIQKSESLRTGLQVGPLGTYSTGVLWHTGWDAPPDSPHRSSISCFTSNLRWLTLASKAKLGGVIRGRLINAWDLVPIMARYPFEAGPTNLA